MKTPFILSSALAIHAAIAANESQIESLDRAIGDGDHYINMKRGTEVIAGMYTNYCRCHLMKRYKKLAISY